jgi:hypothetical protein
VGEIFIEAKYALKAKCSVNLAVSSAAVFQNTQTRHFAGLEEPHHAALESIPTCFKQV